MSGNWPDEKGNRCKTGATAITVMNDPGMKSIGLSEKECPGQRPHSQPGDLPHAAQTWRSWAGKKGSRQQAVTGPFYLPDHHSVNDGLSVFALSLSAAKQVQR